MSAAAILRKRVARRFTHPFVGLTFVPTKEVQKRGREAANYAAGRGVRVAQRA